MTSIFDFDAPRGSKPRRPRHKSSLNIFLLAAGLGATMMVGFVLAAPTTLPPVTFHIAAAGVPECLAGAEVSFTYSVSDTNVTTIASVSVEGIDTSCDGQFFALALMGTNDTVIDEILWELDSAGGATSITAIANGSTTSAQNTLAGNAYEVYPSGQTDPEGLDLTIESSDVIGLEVEILPSSRSARN